MCVSWVYLWTYLLGSASLVIFGRTQQATNLNFSLQRKREGAELASDSCVSQQREVWFAFLSASSSPPAWWGKCDCGAGPATPELCCKSGFGSVTRTGPQFSRWDFPSICDSWLNMVCVSRPRSWEKYHSSLLPPPAPPPHLTTHFWHKMDCTWLEQTPWPGCSSKSRHWREHVLPN